MDDPSPGSGARTPARAWLPTDAPSSDLSGEWLFRWHPSLSKAPDHEEWPDDEGEWDRLPVPSHWVLAGGGRYGRPIYTTRRFPIPVTGRVPRDDNPTGDHRRFVDLDESWAAHERVLLRFDGVESRYRVWLNGAEIGIGAGSRLVQEFDVTSAVRPGRNVLDVRVHQWSSSTWVEAQDQWWLPGIFREVTLLARPAGALDDVWLDAGFDHQAGAGTITPWLTAPAAAYPVRLRVEALGLDVCWEQPEDVAPIAAGQVKPWTAETPVLYEATVASAGETVRVRLGFRTVRIRGDRFEVNGRPIAFRGVNRHEIHRDRGRVFDVEDARRDLVRMKRHNINAIRTSHYPPHPRLLDLADELGFWVIDECDLESQGFEDVGWADNPSDDPAWSAAYLDRIRRTVERDKNHPSVVMWSLGNESYTGRNLAANAAWVRGRDPGRPVHYEGDLLGEYTDVHSRMYATPDELRRLGEDDAISHDLPPGAQARVRSMPVILCEYAHAMGNGPGALHVYEELFDRYPRLHGGFVWEWRDHALTATADDGTTFLAYGGDFGERVTDGVFVIDGLLGADEVPSPGLAEFARVIQPVRARLGEDGLVVENRQDFADLSAFTLRWRLERDGELWKDGLLEVRAAARSAARVPWPVDPPAADGAEWWLTVTAQLAAPAPWAPAGHEVARSQVPVRPRGPERAPVASAQVTRATPSRDRDVVRVGTAQLDARTGRLLRIGGFEMLDGPALELYRAPTDNDRGSSVVDYLLSGAAEPRQPAPTPSAAQRWRKAGLTRLAPDVLAVDVGADAVEVHTRVGVIGAAHHVDIRFRWWAEGDEVVLRTSVEPSLGWTGTSWPRIGLRLTLPDDVRTAEWFGLGPGETYPDSREAATVGKWRSDVDGLATPYLIPQENGHRSELRWLELARADGRVLRVETRAMADGTLPGFALQRWTPAELEAAAHRHELPPSDRTHLHVDAYHHGLGSRSCIVDVLPEHQLLPRSASWQLRLSIR
ncbi:beta-galactosidase [Jiangella anatolica]|uniref:Beta-galactosidase n=1 Tax=Jiangella anatolica TaxID=2670374 RepID=A0A2W2C0S3_9ACTN|nr:beta-galactosidase [Jiangella anatolica]